MIHLRRLLIAIWCRRRGRSDHSSQKCLTLLLVPHAGRWQPEVSRNPATRSRAQRPHQPACRGAGRRSAPGRKTRHAEARLMIHDQDRSLRTTRAYRYRGLKGAHDQDITRGCGRVAMLDDIRFRQPTELYAGARPTALRAGRHPVPGRPWRVTAVVTNQIRAWSAIAATAVRRPAPGRSPWKKKYAKSRSLCMETWSAGVFVPGRQGKVRVSGPP